jgi:UMF1 family MFS transporter
MKTSIMDKKIIAAWCSYDFANSIYYAVIPSTIWSSYYANYIVGNSNGLGDLWWGRAVSTTMLVVAIISPIMGAIADQAQIKKRLLAIYTVFSIIATCLLGLIAPGMILLGFLLSVISFVGLEGALVFYNSYLPEIAPSDYQGRVSGWGFALGYAGSLFGLLIILPFVRQNQYSLAFLITGIGFLLFTIPSLIWLPKDAHAGVSVMEAAKSGLKLTWEALQLAWHTPQMRNYLFAYLFFEDGTNTIINMSAIFASKTLGFNATELILLFAVVQISALLGSLAWAKPTDRFGPKKIISILLIQWAIVVITTYFVQTKTQFFVVAVLAGTGLGAIQSASRAMMSLLIPTGKEAELFGLYALCGKSASIMGPILFGAVSVYSGGNQRLSILSILVFYVIGGLLLRRSPKSKIL